MSKALLGVAQSKKKTKKILLLFKEVLGHVNHF